MCRHGAKPLCPAPFPWGPWIDIPHIAEAFRSSGLYRVFSLLLKGKLVGKENIESVGGGKVESQSAGAAMLFVIVNNSEDFAISEWNVRKGDFKHFFVPK